jgi:LAGLIDADG DNA endonuclease family protein
MESGTPLRSGLLININDFSEEGVLLLVKMLYNKYNITSNIKVDSDNNYRIVLDQENFILFRDLVKNTIYRSMRNKFKL